MSKTEQFLFEVERDGNGSIMEHVAGKKNKEKGGGSMLGR